MSNVRMSTQRYQNGPTLQGSSTLHLNTSVKRASCLLLSSQSISVTVCYQVSHSHQSNKPAIQQYSTSQSHRQVQSHYSPRSLSFLQHIRASQDVSHSSMHIINSVTPTAPTSHQACMLSANYRKPKIEMCTSYMYSPSSCICSSRKLPTRVNYGTPRAPYMRLQSL